MIVVLYDRATGRIEQNLRGAEASIDAMLAVRPDLAALPVDEARDDYDRTHHVVDGQLVERIA